MQHVLPACKPQVVCQGRSANGYQTTESMHLHQHMLINLIASRPASKVAMFVFQTALTSKMADDVSYHVGNRHCCPLHTAGVCRSLLQEILRHHERQVMVELYGLCFLIGVWICWQRKHASGSPPLQEKTTTCTVFVRALPQQLWCSPRVVLCSDPCQHWICSTGW